MTVLKVKRLATNPHRAKVRVKPRAKKNAAKRTRHMSAKQIRIFGTKRQKAALKAKRTKAAKPAHRTRTSPNPVVLTLGAINPKRRSQPMAAKRKAKNARARVVSVSRPRRNRRRVVAVNRRHHRRTTHNPRTRKNTTRIVMVAPRRMNRRHHKRNPGPSLFGQSLTSPNALKMLGGGLIGVAATKFIPTSLPTSLTSGIASSTFGKVAISAASALVAWWLGSKLDNTLGEGILFGGLMQTASVALNAFLPTFNIGGVSLSLGDLVEGRFAVPQNPLRGNGMRALPPAPSNMPAPAGAKVTSSGLGRAYPSAY